MCSWDKTLKRSLQWCVNTRFIFCSVLNSVVKFSPELIKNTICSGFSGNIMVHGAYFIILQFIFTAQMSSSG